MRWFEAWKASLPDGTVCGREDILFDPEFETLQNEVNKNDALQADSRTDWGLVLEMATSLLSTRAKDLWVFCYGCRAVYEQNGISGLSASLEIVTHYLDAHWDELYPSAARAARRAAPFLWLIAKLEILMPASAFPVEKQESYDVFRQALGALQGALDSRMGENAPSFRNILRAIPEKKKETPPVRAAAPVAPASILPAESARVVANLDGDGRVPDSILPQLLRAMIEQAQQLGRITSARISATGGSICSTARRCGPLSSSCLPPTAKKSPNSAWFCRRTRRSPMRRRWPANNTRPYCRRLNAP